MCCYLHLLYFVTVVIFSYIVKFILYYLHVSSLLMLVFMYRAFLVMLFNVFLLFYSHVAVSISVCTYTSIKYLSLVELMPLCCC